MSETPVLKALLTGLQADKALGRLVTAIHEHAPDDAAAPYITLHRLRLMDASTKTSMLFSLTADLMVWDQSASSRRVRQIVERLRILAPDLVADSGHLIGLLVQDTDMARDSALNWIRARVTLSGHYSP